MGGEEDEARESNQNGKRMIGAGRGGGEDGTMQSGTWDEGGWSGGGGGGFKKDKER